MEKMLTAKEKQVVNKLLDESTELSPTRWSSWSPWVVLTLGGFLILSVSLIVLGNLTAFNIQYVLLPGVLTGCVLLLGGAWGLYMSRKMEEQKILAGLLKKLLA